ncbi:MAG: glycosyltransferase family 1 protein [Chloroflexi bacterium]|nr:MAG: glycosyltransferase family 1 protein [Chloroflexota bacterium]
MRVAMLSMHTSPLAALGGRETGGMNVYVREVAAQLAALGVEVDVFTRRIDAATPEIQELGNGARLVNVTAGAVERLEKEELPPLVGAFADGVEAFRAHEAVQYDLVHSHYWLSVAAGDLLVQRWDVPHIAMFHTLGDVKLRARASEHESPERLETERRVVHALDRIVAATVHERQLLKQLYGVSPSKVAVIPLGVNLELFQQGDRAAARAVLGIPANDRLVLAVGRIEPLKGFDILVRALAEMTVEHVHLALVGGDERASAEQERLLAVARELGIEDRVHLVGAVPHERLRLYYQAADAVAVPSFYESFGLVAVEAMASGIPVVASRVGGLTSTITDGRTGYLIPWRCPSPFAEKLDLLFQNIPLRDALGANAAQAMQAYSWQSVASALLDQYSALIAERVAPAAAGGA